MCIFHEYVEINSADYSDSGYIPLYPLLNRYWDKPLAEMPQKLRFRVEKAVPSWDKIDSSYRSINDSVSQLTLRQKCVFLYDIKRDPTQEWETYIALEGYIRGGYSPAEYPLGGYVPDSSNFLRGQLPVRIDKTISNGMTSVADAMRDDVAMPLEKICSEFGIHWPNPNPLLWSELYQFREMTLPSLIDKAKCENNDLLVTELGYVSTYISRILNLDRQRVGKPIELEWETTAAAQASPIFLELGKISPDKLTPKQIQEGDYKIWVEEEYDAAGGEPMRIVRQRGNAILSWLKKNNHDPQDLPAPFKNGLATVKSICRRDLCKNKKMFSSEKLFEKAWQQLRNDKEIIGLK